MKFELHIPLNPTPEQAARLLALQAAFAQLCNALAPMVQSTRVWNRVALHHMAYKRLREQFPAIGSQMVCNAIYSVSRHSRALFQSPGSPFNIARLGERPLPRLQFTDSCPVYFDRHTLSLKEGQLSMYTLDGRMRFQVHLPPEAEARFHQMKLREVVLTRQIAPPPAGGAPNPAVQRFVLAFTLSDEAGTDNDADVTLTSDVPATGEAPALPPAPQPDLSPPLPDYLKIEELNESA